MNDDVVLTRKFDHLYDIIKTDTFLDMHALGGEIPFFITTFAPQQQVPVDSHISALKNKLNTHGVPVLELNLFDLCLDILRARHLLDKTIEMEPTVPKERLLNMLRMPLDVEHNLIPEIARRINSFDGKVVFLTGIGLVFPYIRSRRIRAIRMRSSGVIRICCSISHISASS